MAGFFTIDIEKQMGNEFWTNVYTVFAESLTAAGSAVTIIGEAERLIHTNSVTFTKGRARTVEPGDDSFLNVPLGYNGITSDSAANQLPLFNVLRVDLVIGSGRPNRKYYRPPLNSGQMEDGVLLAGAVNGYQIVMNELIADLGSNGTPWIDSGGGTAVLGAVVFPTIGMRQLRRGSKRKLQPVLP